jgi:hypothetical protein
VIGDVFCVNYEGRWLDTHLGYHPGTERQLNFMRAFAKEITNAESPNMGAGCLRQGIDFQLDNSLRSGRVVLACQFRRQAAAGCPQGCDHRFLRPIVHEAKSMLEFCSCGNRAGMESRFQKAQIGSGGGRTPQGNQK